MKPKASSRVGMLLMFVVAGAVGAVGFIGLVQIEPTGWLPDWRSEAFLAMAIVGPVLASMFLLTDLILNALETTRGTDRQ